MSDKKFADQPKTLWMADQLEEDQELLEVSRSEIAAELRQLHGEHLEDQTVIAVWRGRTLRAEQQRDELAARIAKDDRVLRSSVPERWKGCTSHVGAAQSYIAELESDRDELLQALKWCLEKGSRWHPCDPTVVAARSAIAKATGATQ